MSEMRYPTGLPMEAQLCIQRVLARPPSSTSSTLKAYRPDPPRAFASLQNVADFPVEIGDRAGLAARARSRLAESQRISFPLVSPRSALILVHGTGAGE